MIESVLATSAESEVVLCLDQDDPELDCYTALYDSFERTAVSAGQPLGRSAAVERAVAACRDRYSAFLIATDDALFIAPGWEEAVRLALEDAGSLGVAALDDGVRVVGKRAANWLCVSVGFVKALGRIHPPLYMESYCQDTAISALALALGTLRWVEGAFVRHLEIIDPKAIDKFQRDAHMLVRYMAFDFADDLEKLRAAGGA